MRRAKEILAQGGRQQPAKVVTDPDRISNKTVIEPAAPNARPVYWEAADGQILGPAGPESLAMVGSGQTAAFWVVVTYDGSPRWVQSERLRSEQQFKNQA